MIGKIASYSTAVNAGYVTADGKQYAFSIIEWIGDVSPVEGLDVEFTERSEKAVHVRPVKKPSS